MRKRLLAFVLTVVAALSLAVGCGGPKDSGPEADCRRQAHGVINAFLDTKNATDVVSLAMLYGDTDNTGSGITASLDSCKPLTDAQRKAIDDDLKSYAPKLEKHFEDIGLNFTQDDEG